MPGLAPGFFGAIAQYDKASSRRIPRAFKTR